MDPRLVAVAVALARSSPLHISFSEHFADRRRARAHSRRSGRLPASPQELHSRGPSPPRNKTGADQLPRTKHTQMISSTRTSIAFQLAPPSPRANVPPSTSQKVRKPTVHHLGSGTHPAADTGGEDESPRLQQVHDQTLQLVFTAWLVPKILLMPPSSSRVGVPSAWSRERGAAQNRYPRVRARAGMYRTSSSGQGRPNRFRLDQDRWLVAMLGGDGQGKVSAGAPGSCARGATAAQVARQPC